MTAHIPVETAIRARAQHEALEASAYERGRREALEQVAHANNQTHMADELRRLIERGDFIIRKVNNGYILRLVPSMEGSTLETWAIEGDLNEVAKQLTAIQAKAVQTDISNLKPQSLGQR